MEGNIRADIARSDDADLSDRPTKHRKCHKNPPFLFSRIVKNYTLSLGDGVI
jgi:hypothetical protein